MVKYSDTFSILVLSTLRLKKSDTEKKAINQCIKPIQKTKRLRATTFAFAKLEEQ